MLLQKLRCEYLSNCLSTGWVPEDLLDVSKTNLCTPVLQQERKDESMCLYDCGLASGALFLHSDHSHEGQPTNEGNSVQDISWCSATGYSLHAC